MKTAFASLLLAAAAASHAQAPAPAAVDGAWARSTVAGQDTSGAYMTLTAREPLTLVGAQSPAAGMVDLHEMKMEGEVMKMRAADTLPLAAGQPLRLAPGGYHFMLMDAKHPIKPGDTVHITLHFADGETLQATWPVKPANAE